MQYSYSRDIKIVKDHKPLRAVVILEEYSLYDLEGDLASLIKKLQIAQLTYSDKYTSLETTIREASYDGGYPHILICGVRPPDEDELSKYNAEEAKEEDRRKAYRQAEYQRLKAEFEK